MRGLDGGGGRLRKAHHRREAGHGHQTGAEVGEGVAEDGEVVEDSVCVEASKVGDRLPAPAEDDDKLDRDRDNTETRCIEHQLLGLHPNGAGV